MRLLLYKNRKLIIKIWKSQFQRKNPWSVILSLKTTQESVVGFSEKMMSLSFSVVNQKTFTHVFIGTISSTFAPSDISLWQMYRTLNSYMSDPSVIRIETQQIMKVVIPQGLFSIYQWSPRFHYFKGNMLTSWGNGVGSSLVDAAVWLCVIWRKPNERPVSEEMQGQSLVREHDTMWPVFSKRAKLV